MTPTEPKQEPQSNIVGPRESDMTPAWGVSVSGDAGTVLASGLLPVLLVIGAAVAAFGEWSLPAWPVVLASLTLAVALLAFLLHEGRWHVRDLRWLWVPIIIAVTSFVDPSWTGPMLWDQSDHLQTANRYLGRWSWEPYHMDQNFAFRPKVVSGLAAIELALTGQTSRVFFVPWVILVASGWQVQRLSEEAGAGRWSLLAPLLVLTLPAMMEQGRTVYLEALATGGLMLALRVALRTLQEQSTTQQEVGRGAVMATVGLAKFPYLYLGPALAVIAGWRQRSLQRAGWVLLGWAALVAPFTLSDRLNHGHYAASLDPQVTGTLASLTSDVGPYGPILAFEDMLMELLPSLHVLFALGVVLWVLRDAKPRAVTVAGLLLPSLVLFAFVLDFGWPRYHLPWLAGLICLGLAGLTHHAPAHDVFRHAAWRPAVLSLIVILASLQINAVVGEALEEREDLEATMAWRWELFDHYSALGSSIPDDAVVLAGYDISLGLRYGEQTYRFGPSDDPIHDSIEVVSATHVVTGGIATRFAWEDDPMMLLGAPLSVVTHTTRGSDHHILWSVDPTRMASHDGAAALSIGEARKHVGDAMLVDGGLEVEVPEGWTWIEAFDAGQNNADGSTVVDLLLGLETSAEPVCAASCPETISIPEGTTYLLRVGLDDA